MHTAGLRVIAVSNPEDAYRSLRQAIASDDPVIFFEPKRLYHHKGEVDLEAPLAMRRRWDSRASCAPERMRH